ncbi:helix-turn-helix domain-containing protein [Actinacidiphila glaucinigra]|uniref:AlbA family DNA-binding domain-containing protein n=1 Tax=Actinacidiphila glaucinigra TaxID=235986 RepID=UPI003AF393F2
MARSWTRLHEHLGAPPGPLSFDMVKKAAETNVAESDDLDWKEKLPQPPRDGAWNELAKDVAAMANTRGGLLVYGVTDKTTIPVGINPGEVNPQQYAQWIRNHVQPYLPDLTFTTLTSPDGALSFLVIDIPASPMAPPPRLRHRRQGQRPAGRRRPLPGRRPHGLDGGAPDRTCLPRPLHPHSQRPGRHRSAPRPHPGQRSS